MDAPQQSSWFNRNKAWVIPIGCLFMVFGGTCAVCAGGLGVAAVKGGGALTEELGAVKRLPLEAGVAVRNDADVKRLLGEPVQVGETQHRGYQNHNGVGDMRFVLPLTGPKQTAVAEVYAVRSPETGWKLRTIEVKAANGDTIKVKDETESPSPSGGEDRREGPPSDAQPRP